MSATKYILNGVTVWKARWYEPVGTNGDRRQRAKRGFATKREALAYVRAQQARIDQGVTPLADNVTVTQWLNSWMNGLSGYKPTTMAAIQRDVDTHLVPHIGTRMLSEIKPNDLRAFYALLHKHGKRAGNCRTAYMTCRENACSPEKHAGLEVKTIKSVHFALRTALRQAVRDGVLTSNPAEASDLLPRKKMSRAVDVRTRTWSRGQAQHFLAIVAGDRLEALWRLTLATGMRRGEVCGLKWHNVELDATPPHLYVRGTIVVAAGVNLEMDDAKTESSTRRIVLDAQTVSHLKRWRRVQSAERLAAGERYRASGYVFTDEVGEPLKPAWLSTWAKRHADRNGLPNITFHGLRHTAASLTLAAGVPITIVAQRLGHKDPSITLAVYSHAIPSDDAIFADTMASLLGG